MGEIKVLDQYDGIGDKISAYLLAAVLYIGSGGLIPLLLWIDKRKARKVVPPTHYSQWVPNIAFGGRCRHGWVDPRGRAACHDCYCPSGMHTSWSDDGQWVLMSFPIPQPAAA